MENIMDRNGLHSNRFSFQAHAAAVQQPPEIAAWNNNNNNNSSSNNSHHDNRWVVPRPNQQQPDQAHQAASGATSSAESSRTLSNRPCLDPGDSSQSFVWTRIFPSSQGSGAAIQPPPRSGAASVVVCGRLYIFGGYGGGTGRLDDFYCFHFQSQSWEVVEVLSEEKPGCRENNGVVIADDANKSIFLFGGYDGQSWLNDLWKFDIETKRWTCLQESTSGSGSSPNHHSDTTANDNNDNDASLESTTAAAAISSSLRDAVDESVLSVVGIRGRVPSRRFGYVSVVHEGRFIVWGGFDGSRWLNDMYVYTFANRTWTQVEQPPHEGMTAPSSTNAVWPSVRSCPAWAKDDRYVYIQGGYDGVERKSDFFALDLNTYTWREMPSHGAAPSPRYFHSCGIHGNKLYLYGGYSGSERLADLYAYDLETQHWTRIEARGGDIPSGRSSLVLQVYESSLYCFGGYNGQTVLNDFYKFRLKPINLPPTTLVQNLSQLIQNQDLADVVFLVEGKLVYANRAILAIRSDYFRVMLCGGMRESASSDVATVATVSPEKSASPSKLPASEDGTLTGDEIFLPDVSYEVFLRVLEFIYTDTLIGELSLEIGIHLLIASEQFMLDRLKALCEDLIRRDIRVDNVTEILAAAHRHNADGLKDLALEFILAHLNNSTVMDGLSELKSEPDLLLEIIKRNSVTLHSPVQRHSSSGSNSTSGNNNGSRHGSTVGIPLDGSGGSGTILRNASLQQNNNNASNNSNNNNAMGSIQQHHHDVYYVPAADGRLLLPSWGAGGNSGSSNNNNNNINHDERSHLAGAGGMHHGGGGSGGGGGLAD